MKRPVSVIIPTLALRPLELERAIASVLGQDEVGAVPIVVVNGDRYDPRVVDRLRRRRDVRLRQIEPAGVSAARLEGRRRVETPYFGFLDDDDELLPNAMRVRLGGFADGDFDAVATNGYLEERGRRTPGWAKFNDHRDDPAMALLEENWLSSAAGLYRTDRIEERSLRDLPDVLEWTYFAFLLAQNHRVNWINEPTFVIHVGAAGQVTRSRRYRQEAPNVFRRMERLTTRPDLRARLRRKRSAAWHDCSVAALRQGDRIDAWKYHLRSLMVSGGLRYLSYSRRLLGPMTA